MKKIFLPGKHAPAGLLNVPMRLLMFVWACMNFPVSTFAQDQKEKPDYRVHFNAGIVTPGVTKIEMTGLQSALVNKKYHVLLQFYELPGTTQRELLSQHGIDLYQYMPEKAFYASIPAGTDPAILQRCGARAVLEVKPYQRLQESLRETAFLQQSETAMGTMDVMVEVLHNQKIPRSTFYQYLKAMNFLSLARKNDTINQVETFRVSAAALKKLSEIPYVVFIQPVEQAELSPTGCYGYYGEYDGNGHHNTAWLQFPKNKGGLGLTGKNVVVNVHDVDFDSSRHHPELANRVIVEGNGNGGSPFYGHGRKTTGMLGMGGMINARATGHAPRVKILQQNGAWLTSMASDVATHNMVLISMQLGSVTRCSLTGVDTFDRGGSYLGDEADLDAKLIQFDKVSYFGSAHNLGNHPSCFGYPRGYLKINEAYGPSKNGICVGALQQSGVIGSSSSKGPCMDGRTKPDIVASGANPMLTDVTGGQEDLSCELITYWGTATSYSTPAATGSMALLYERYRELHGADPKGSLMKALLLNNADDLGNTGPDYTYGFGRVNAKRAVETMSNGHYQFYTVMAKNTYTHPLVAPAGAYQLKLMVYWHDKEGTVSSAKALVDDIDMHVKEVSNLATIYRYPFKLDGTASGVTLPATTGISSFHNNSYYDRLNNMEQIVIPVEAGNAYQVSLIGQNITTPEGRECVLTWTWVKKEVVITNPLPEDYIGREMDAPNAADTFRVRFEAPGSTSLALSYYNYDNGTWTMINNNINPSVMPHSLGYYDWHYPNITGKIMLRLENSTGQSYTAQHIHLMRRPAITQVTSTALGSSGVDRIDFTAVPGATVYEAYRYNFDSLRWDYLGQTNNTYYLNMVPASSADRWYSIIAKKTSGTPCMSERSMAKKITGVNTPFKMPNPVSETGTKEQEEGLVLYPNPSTGIITLMSLKEDKLTVSIYNANGQAVMKRQLFFNDGRTGTLDLEKLSKGIYILVAGTPEGKIYTRKIILTE